MTRFAKTNPARTRLARTGFFPRTGLVFFTTIALMAAGCAQRGTPEAEPAAGTEGNRIRVVATFYPLAEFTERIGGDRVEVQTLVPPGVEAHDYEPTPSGRTAVARAQVFVYNGAGFEPWVDRVLPELSGNTITVNTTDGLPLRTPAGTPHAGDTSSDGIDPHVWLDPVLARTQVERIQAALIQADPDGAEVYEERGRTFSEELDRLHQRYTAALRSCRHREFVTAHAAFGYLAARYGLAQVAISVDPEAEPTPGRMREVVRLMRDRGITSVYAESLEEARGAETIAEETGATLRVLDPLEGLSPQERARGLNYVVVMDENLQQLADGLDCAQ